MNVTPQQFFLVVSVTTSVTTAIFWGAYLLGKLVGRIERAEVRLEDHERAIQELRG